MSKLLLVEDDESLALGINFTLEDEGYEVVSAPTIKEAKIALDSGEFDLIILDVNLPDGNGYELCKKIRMTSDTPIIFLTALDEEVNIVLGLEIGGDDYITKPFRVRELLSRVKALIRRNSRSIVTGRILTSGNLIVDTYRVTIKKDNIDISITAQEYKILLMFINNPFILIKREDILKSLTQEDNAYFDENTLSVYIKRIREKIEDDPKTPKYIITKRGLGYKWDKEVSKKRVRL